MALLLTESDVRSLLTMPVALEAVEDSFRRLADGSALLHSRQRLHVPGASYLHYMAAADAASGTMGMKIYTSSRQGLRFLVPLFDIKAGDLLAVLEADYLGQMRTGAASGLATRLLARPEARVVGMIGTGVQARTQLEAVGLVRRLDRARVFGRDPARREQFAREMSLKLGLAVEPARSCEEAVRDADIVITATTASQAVVEGRWLKPGAHINAVGANFPNKRELDDEAIHRASLIVADSVAQSREESGDLIQALGEDEGQWSRVIELADLIAGRPVGVPHASAGRAQGRTGNDQITLFKSNGIASEDIVTAARVYELARQRGVGRQLSLWEKEARAGNLPRA